MGMSAPHDSRAWPRCVWDLGAELGEGPVWSPRDRALWFVDIKRRQILRYSPDPQATRSWDAPEQVSFILPLAGGGWAVGLQSGVHRFEPETGMFSMPCTPERHPRGNRLNDGYVDHKGRLWFGTMDDAERERTGNLYRLDADGRARVQDGGYGIANGPAASPDGKLLYHTDTRERVIYAFDVGEDGCLAGKREFIRFTRAGVGPDGHVVDVEGCLWVALFGGWGIERYSPRGELIEHVAFPCANITKPAFGGDDLKTVYATTARLHLSPKQREVQTLAGALFSFQSKVSGLPQHEIAQGL